MYRVAENTHFKSGLLVQNICLCLDAPIVSHFIDTNRPLWILGVELHRQDTLPLHLTEHKYEEDTHQALLGCKPDHHTPKPNVVWGIGKCTIGEGDALRHAFDQVIVID